MAGREMDRYLSCTAGQRQGPSMCGSAGSKATRSAWGGVKWRGLFSMHDSSASPRTKAGETKRIKPMLAAPFEDHKHKLVYPVTVQPKFDGVRCLAFRKADGTIMLQSRGGDPYELPHIQNEISPWLGNGWILDGELYIHGTSLQ